MDFKIRSFFDDLSRGGRTASGKSFKATTRGFFDGQTIYLHEGQTTFDAVVEIFKHEITHYAELNPEMYEKYAKAVFGSKAFEKWISEQKVDGEKIKGRSHPVRLGQYRDSIIKKYEKHGVSLESKKKTDGRSPIDREIIAYFTSEMLFNEKGNTLERLINEVNSEDRNVVLQFIHDVISWLKTRLKGEKASFEITRLENRFAAVLRNVDNTNAQKNNTTNDGDVQYEFNENLYKQLNDWLKGGGRKNGAYNGSYFELGTTPNVLIKHGAPAVNVIMYSDVITKITGGKHSIALNEISKLPTQLNDPILLFKGSIPNSFVALTELVDKNGNDVIVAVHINKHLGRTVINKIASLYSKSDDYGNNKIVEYIKRQISAGNLIDASNIKAPNWFTSRGLQLPKEVQTILDANNKISQKDNVVNTHYMQESENYSSPEQNNDGVSYSFGDIDVYDEAQYNDFGWVRYNDVLSASEYSTLLSRYADYKHNKHNYPTTRFGEAVIHSSELPDVIMYVKGPIVSPQIIKAVRIETDSYTASSIKGWILQNEYRQVSQPYSVIESLYGQEVLSIYRKRDYEPFWEYQARAKRNGSPTSDTTGGTEQDGTRGTQQNKATDRAGLDNSAFSMPENDGNSYSFGDIDKGNKKRDNISRANKRGELINEFYYALDKSEWNLFYRKIAESGFLEKTDVGDRVAIAIGGKLLIADRQLRGTDAHDFQIVAAYQEENGDWYVTNEIADIINESEDIYDQRTVEKTILRVSKIYDETPIFSVYDREHMQFISSSSFGKTNGRSTTTDGGYRTRTYGEGISSPVKQNTQRINAGLDDSAFSMPENEGMEYSFEDDVVDKTSSLAERVRLGEISQTEYLNELQQLMDEATEKYGAIPKLNRDLKKTQSLLYNYY